MISEALRTWQMAGQLIEVNGYKIFVRVMGKGEPILVLHGFPTASYDFVRLFPLLKDQFCFISFDFLGYGFSDKPQKHPYSLFEQADITQGVAHHFGLEQVYLLTHDMGNSVALEILQRGTPVVERLILLNGSVLLDYYRPLLTQKLLLHPVIGPVITRWRLIKKPMFARQFGKLFAQKPPQTEIDDFWELIGHNQGMANYHLLIQYLNERLVHQHTWLSALKNHSAPLTVIWGQRDPVSVPKIAEAILTCRPDASYHPLAEVGHFPQWEAPETVAKIIATAFN